MMLSRAFPLALLVFALSASAGLAQTTVSDSQAAAILNLSLNASGAMNPLNPIQDFTAAGTITYFWAGEQTQGTATVRARGADQFRLDSNLPDGVRSYAVSRAKGAEEDPDGKVTSISVHNTINVGVLTFPYPSLAAALNDPSTTVSYVGPAQVNGRAAHQIRVQRHFPQNIDRRGTLTKLAVKDYFVDAQSYLLLKTQEMTHPPETMLEDLAHEMEFENYMVTNGVAVPMLVREKIIGQTIWELRLSSVAFNTGLTDFDFTLR